MRRKNFFYDASAPKKKVATRKLFWWYLNLCVEFCENVNFLKSKNCDSKSAQWKVNLVFEISCNVKIQTHFFTTRRWRTEKKHQNFFSWKLTIMHFRLCWRRCGTKNESWLKKIREKCNIEIWLGKLQSTPQRRLKPSSEHSNKICDVKKFIEHENNRLEARALQNTQKQGRRVVVKFDEFYQITCEIQVVLSLIQNTNSSFKNAPWPPK